jgi:predicted ATPase
MIQLRIKNFGPIRQGMAANDGWLEFKRVTVFIGNQGSGKSTLAKLFSTFSWMEKALVRGDYDQKWFERKGRLESRLLTYHRLEHYLHPDELDTSVLEYKGNAFHISYLHGQLHISPNATRGYQLPQVMYVPAERNFIAYVRHPKELKLSSEALKEFLTEYEKAKANMGGAVQLPINNSELEYDKLNDILNLKGQGYKLRLTDASSGFQSLVPVYLVSRHLAQTVQLQEKEQQTMSEKERERFSKWATNIFANETLTEEQQRAAISSLAARFNKTAFVNIVEEPEQNLFPSSQWEILKSLLECNAQGAHNRLVLTTHSPYIVSYLSLCVQAYQLHRKLQTRGRTDLLSKLTQIVPMHAMIDPHDLAIYQSDEVAGTVTPLSTFEGIPSDSNMLNHFLRQGNDLFDQLLALEEEI